MAAATAVAIIIPRASITVAVFIFTRTTAVGTRIMSIKHEIEVPVVPPVFSDNPGTKIPAKSMIFHTQITKLTPREPRHSKTCKA